MSNHRPHYGRYLLWWLGLWLLLTVPTQIPECYERSFVNGPWDHMSVSKELIGFMEGRFLIEIPFGLLWGSLSWLLQRGASRMLSRFRTPRFFQTEASQRLWTRMAGVVLLAFLEAALLGMPLAIMNPALVNFPAGPDVCLITDRSILIESTGILLAFPLACLAAGYFGGGRRKPIVMDDVTNQDDAWPPAPRDSA